MSTNPERVRTPAGASRRAWAPFLAPVLVAAIGALSPALAADPAPPADESKPAPSEKPMRFTDDDLEKYRKKAPGAESPAAVPEAPTPKPAPVPATAKSAAGKRPAPPTKLEPVPKPAPGTTPSTPAPAAAPPRPVPSTRPVPAVASQEIAKPPAADPLKRWKDREELESFREEQLRNLRTQITGLESRLEYLNLKRLSILDPTRIMPMPQTDADRAADKAPGPRDLLAVVEKEIETTEADLKQAKDALITIETRFAQETGRS
jgi:hypothetical protein